MAIDVLNEVGQGLNNMRANRYLDSEANECTREDARKPKADL